MLYMRLKLAGDCTASNHLNGQTPSCLFKIHVLIISEFFKTPPSFYFRSPCYGFIAILIVCFRTLPYIFCIFLYFSDEFGKV